jgi:hypothetical protein
MTKMTRFLAQTGALLAAFAALTPAAFAQKLTTTQIPDGTGSIGLAEGWKMASGANGAVSAVGPNGAMMDLGIPLNVVTRGVEALFPDVGAAAFPGVTRVDFNDPVRAFLDVAAAIGPKTGIRLTKIRSIEYITGWPNGKAAYIRYTVSVKGKSQEAFGIYAIMPIDNVSGMFYYSVVTAPTATFNKQFPTMLAMWKSWSLNDATARQRLADAAASLAGVDYAGAMKSVNENRKAAGERTAARFNAYIRQ